MSLFALSAVGAAGLAPTFAGLIEQNPHLQWRWIQWLNLMQVVVTRYAIFRLKVC